MAEAKFFCFRDGHLEPVTSSPDSEVRLTVADSWLTDNGRTRDLQVHFERFADWVREQNPDCNEDLEPFFEAVSNAIPDTGRWFPRIEFHGEAVEPNHLYLRLREAPEQLGAITLWTSPDADPRVKPRVKGPDLSLCLQLRRAAQMHGADEAVITSTDGHLIEGALSSIVWWRGEVLCAPDHQTPWLDSVTRKEVFAIAQEMGYSTRLEHIKPADLVGLEIWALSSLQGIRPVEDWVNLGSPVGKATHVDAFSRRLRLKLTSIR
ncbi:MAG: hypothetical protein RIS82_191 [Actinomycetota bacterium]